MPEELEEACEDKQFGSKPQLNVGRRGSQMVTKKLLRLT